MELCFVSIPLCAFGVIIEMVLVESRKTDPTPNILVSKKESTKKLL